MWRRDRPERTGQSGSSQPERSCVGCGRKTSPSRLDRIARRPDGSLVVGRQEPGRGAWVCLGSPACFEQAVKRRAFERALRVPPGTIDIEGLRARLYGAAPEGAQDRPRQGAEEQ